MATQSNKVMAKANHGKSFSNVCSLDNRFKEVLTFSSSSGLFTVIIFSLCNTSLAK